MPRLIAALLLSTVLAAAEPLIAPGQEGPLKVGDAPPCVLYVPPSHQPGKALPLILFMHGSGAQPSTQPFRSAVPDGYLICGLSYGGLPGAGASGITGDAASKTAMVKFIDQARALIDERYGVDQSRVFLSGLSMGGWGVNMYGLTKEAAGKYRGYAIIAAGVVAEQADPPVAAGRPLLVLNGAQDANLAAANAGMPLLEAAGVVAEQVVLPGQGHVPSLATMDGPLRDWLKRAETIGPRARPVAIAWTAATPTDAPAKSGDAPLGAWLAAQPAVQAAPADRPLLVFIASDAGASSDKPSDKRLVEDAAFSYPGATRVPLAARSFTCIALDTGRLDPARSKVLSSATAPMVAVLKADRSVAAVLKGRQRLTDAALWAELKKLLAADAVAEVERLATEQAPTVKELKEALKQLAAKDERIATLQAAPAKDDATRAAKKQRLAEEREARKALDERCAELTGTLTKQP